MGRRTIRVVFVCIVVAASLILRVAWAGAGAPNFECRVGSTRIGIDNHRRAALLRNRFGDVRQASVSYGTQDGVSLDLVTDLGEEHSTIVVTGTGSTMTYSPAKGPPAIGACAFVPGSYILGQVTGTKAVIRSAASRTAPVLAVVGRRSFIWSYGRYLPSNTLGPKGWTQVRVVTVVRGGKEGGGEQAVGMAAESGLDGRSAIVDGWTPISGLSLLENPRAGQ